MQSDTTKHLFAYGTLMIPEIWTAVTGSESVGEPATLRSHARLLVAGADFPGLVVSNDPNRRVAGCLYRDLDESLFQRLDRYEDDFYQRRQVNVDCATGEQLACQTYLVPREHHHLLSDSEWNPETFRANALSRYLACLGIAEPGNSPPHKSST